LALNVSVDKFIDVVEVPLYFALSPEVPELPLVPELPSVPDEPSTPLSPDVPELPLVPDEPLEPEVPDVPASVLVSNLLVAVFRTTTWSDVLPELTPYTISPLRATNSLLPAIVFFFHCPKEKFFYVY
jgi:hypothetical protein